MHKTRNQVCSRAVSLEYFVDALTLPQECKRRAHTHINQGKFMTSILQDFQYMELACSGIIIGNSNP